jgi:hypothetical protein
MYASLSARLQAFLPGFTQMATGAKVMASLVHRNTT